MAKIYSKASRVIVWLGEATDGGAEALDDIRMTAHCHHTNPTDDEPDNPVMPAEDPTILFPDEASYNAILKLLQRPWFQRVWVLQEVAAGRDVLFKCGSAEIGGYAFRKGVGLLTPYLDYPALDNLIGSVAYLIKDAALHPRSEIGPVGRFSLNIRPLSELVDMYKYRKATDLRDKVYALLGMSSDDTDAAGLSANYAIPWRDVFRNVVLFCLSDQASVTTWDEKEVAVVEAEGHFLGQVFRTLTDRQRVEIIWQNMSNQTGKGEPQPSRLTFRASVKAAKPGDFVCVLKDALSPMVIRVHDGYSTIILSAVPWTSIPPQWPDSITKFPISLLLIWDWSESRETPAEDYQDYLSSRGVPECPIAGCKCAHSLDKAARWWNSYLLLSGSDLYEKAGRHLKEAIDAYNFGETSRSAKHTGQEHVHWRKEDERALKGMDELLTSGESANIKTTSGKRGGLSLPHYAFKNGYEVLARLLIENNVNIETRDLGAGEKPLRWAVKRGAEVLVRLLIENGADVEICDQNDWTLLHHSAYRGHTAITKLLTVEGGLDKERGDRYGNKPLHCAARCGDSALIRLLVVELGAEMRVQNDRLETPLHFAAECGSMDVVKVLVELGADKEAQGPGRETPLHSAAAHGKVDVVRVLAELGADKEAKDMDGHTPLHSAVKKGHEDVARVLVELGADKEAQNSKQETPLHLVERADNEAMMDLLI
ncbi:hypothetical protein RB595_001685 [Gaeumannomyces hyphopodioides]